ncbi:carboxylesterase/lipase family protein [Phenylobacterium sp.]|uniref:carboxylesterase/lipase family protein n=1 Tax=Phenylobacterium sp. TaxID=1871053 RepID=UPI002F428066
MTVIETPLGQVRGRQREGFASFRGIRYARPPVGDLRFRPPVPVAPWTDEYDAGGFGASAPQATLGGQIGRNEPFDEDCLFLNIYTPTRPAAPRPVLFWIHGGGYVGGSARPYHGGAFARENDVVVVTINYRLGALGFMHLGHLDPDLAQSVNTGVLDQMCALEWTRDNIAAFGGDPGNVMIFGESAGGTAAALLVGCPPAEGLFHKAAVHSPNVDLSELGEGHVAFTNRCIERLGGDRRSSGLEFLRAASLEALISLSLPDPLRPRPPGLGLYGARTYGFAPAIDGVLIPRPVADTVLARGSGNVPMLLGGCRHEGTLFADTVGSQNYTEQEVVDFFEGEGFDGRRAMEIYEAFAPGSTPGEKLAYALTDTQFRNSTVRILDAAAEAGSACWSWMCTWENDLPSSGLRATHGMDLPFMWGWTEVSRTPTLAGLNPPPDLGPAMRAYWANFARTGRPFAAGEPAWTPYTTPNRPVLLLDAERRMEHALDDDIRAFWFAG